MLSLADKCSVELANVSQADFTEALISAKSSAEPRSRRRRPPTNAGTQRLLGRSLKWLRVSRRRRATNEDRLLANGFRRAPTGHAHPST